MNIQIRPWTATLAEYNAIAAIHNAAWQTAGLTGENRQRHDAGRPAGFLFQRLLAEHEGQLVAHAAYGEDAWNHTPGKYFIEIAVHPQAQRRGAGDALYAQIVAALAARNPAPIFFTATTREDQLGGLALLHKHGFQLIMRHPMSRIDLAAFAGARFAAVQEKVRQAGITLHSMSELKGRDPNWVRHWYDLELAINDDHPLPDRGEPLPFETFASYMDTPLVNTAAAFFALDADGNYVGQSTLNIPDPQSKTITVGMTGVLRTHRRMGIATALKVRAIEFAQAYGAQAIETSNEEHNPMFQLNLMLGFQPAPAWLSYEKRLSPEL
ncbi:MAG: GNAT family N-acetyltransferase [Chloroflexi bacterium]|nr:GNAT family N-acetyltransferase [Chloroflexota bacterium]